MNNHKSLLQGHSIRSEYDTDYSEKTTKLRMKLEDAIVTGNIDAVRQAAASAEHIKDLKILFDEDLDILKLYIASTISSFVVTAIKRGLPKDVAEMSKKTYYSRIARSRNKEELKHINFQMAEELIEAIDRYSINRYSPIVKMAMEYIHNNKFRFIYSKDVSSAIKVNRSYLSKKFSEEVGQTITDYIHRVKMDLAIELMQSNLYRFNEIAELLGYANYPYFSKVFKKLYAKTPHDYMKDN